MKQKNGFTLVELLAVIVILAIVLIIAVPGVLSIINKTKDNTLSSQKKMVEEAARLYITGETNISWVGTDTQSTILSLQVLKERGYLEQKIMNPKTNKEITCAKITVQKIGKVYSYDTEFCDQINDSPRLSSEMIPIVYDGTNWVKADMMNTSNSWFNYDAQMWANVATVSEETRNMYQEAAVGEVVLMNDINGMYTWIPRFKYKLFNVDGTVSPVGNPNLAGDMMIDLELENVKTQKSTGTKNGEWLTHPAFTLGGENLSGFWVGKFEMGLKGATTKEEAEQNIVDSSKVIVKPGVSSWREISFSNVYRVIDGMNRVSEFGFDPGNDPHMMKNMEWGAMAYLTNSKYGKTGNASYTSAEKQVRLNNNDQYITGCGASSQDEIENGVCNAYNTAIGVQASTTGNITGIYDATGGSLEFVMGMMLQPDGTTVSVSESGFTTSEIQNLVDQELYTEVYPYIESDGNCATSTTCQRSFLGDAVKESGPFGMSGYSYNSWYVDVAYFLSSSVSFLVRGRDWHNRNYAGLFAFSTVNGRPAYYMSGRPVIL